MLRHSSRRKSLGFIIESVQFNTADSHVGFHELFYLCLIPVISAPLCQKYLSIISFRTKKIKKSPPQKIKKNKKIVDLVKCLA